MLTPLPIAPPRPTHRVPSTQRADSLNLVAVSSERPHAGIKQLSPAVSFRLPAFGNDPRRVRYTRIEAQTVGGSVAWLRRRSGKAGVQAENAGPVGSPPRGFSGMPQDLQAIRNQLKQEGCPGVDHESIAEAIVALGNADAVHAGPFSADDANSPGMIAHLADLASRAYRALRPPRELVIHPGFAQVARRFQFIQMSHHEARGLAAGAIDIGILAQRLRQLQGDGGEFAITHFSGHGLLWADGRWWEIDPISGEDVDETRAGAAFCTAWVVARRFLQAPAAKALSYARSATANSLLKK
jgi:hypothetical protein